MEKGRRASRADGEATRARILETAGRLFAAQGYAETTGKAIAEQAEADLASINYHFGSRSGLYMAVLAEAHRRFVSLSDLSLLSQGDLAPSQQLEALFDGLVERATQRDGWHAQVLARELVSPSSHLQALFKQELVPKLAVIKRIVSQITGIPENDPALLRCLLNVASPCLMLLMVGQNLPGPLAEVSRMSRPVLVRHLHDFAMAGLKEVGRQYQLTHR
ncbi:MAG TPA: CerR family C-terminal domain-containing protein [Stenotrophomonas sp.]|jgi:AcrR family transcriptional regulator